MPRKKCAPAPETPAAEPIPLAAVLQRSPAMETIRASRDARAEIEPDQPMPEHSVAIAAFRRQREREQAVGNIGNPSMEAVATEALIESQKRTHAQRLKGLKPTPTGFVGLEGHYGAGIRLSRSIDKRTVAVQFGEDRRPSTEETKLLGDNGFNYRSQRGQWERFDKEWPGDNYQDAKAFVASLVKERSSDLQR